MTTKTRTRQAAAARKRQVPEDHRVRTGAMRREQTRIRLLASALGVITDKGPDAAMIDDYTAAAGVSRGTFYNHFATTQDLLRALTGELTDKILAAIEANVARHDDPLVRVTCACLLYMQLAVDYPTWGGFLNRTGTRHGRMADVYIPRDLELARERGTVDFGTVAAAQDLVIGCVMQAIDTVLSGRAPREHLRHTLAVMLRGLGVSKSSIARLVAVQQETIEVPGLLHPQD
jgi:AcrR family transcriptional regulator